MNSNKDKLLRDIVNNKYDLFNPQATGYTDMMQDINKVLNPVLPKTKLVFILTMPNVGSWNGKWTGSSNLYCRVRKVNKTIREKVLKGKESRSWHYSWNDGWGANVEARLVTAPEAKKMEKLSKGFCGYDHFIDEIIWYDEILTESDRKQKQLETAIDINTHF